ncbi:MULTISPECIES: hypothetical protein [unclassified Fusibacter]|uniref:hypothetical protein n=1 Tax=unclassified Fusibacter TaxID=2624464 RepID=UPI00101109D3|nr:MULTISPECIES: hypothetical protein [unclassified Fusibacter]MCK8060894.1 hypothetical protein [Fusibacter sp. A2]NPE23190.1 hypothetical protein [Fusibacter sp. A1]RXV59548.1 hypothetical protein DWB64_15270 [Fusibacter sp. A1]
MEWSKTKNILIIALIVTNLIIGYFIWNKSMDKDIVDENSRVADLISILSTQQIDVSSVRLPTIETMPVINAAFIGYDLDVLAPIMLKDPYEKLENSEGQVEYIDGDYRLSLENQYTMRLIAIEDENLDTPIVYPTIDTAKQIAEAFISGNLHLNDDYEFVRSELTGTGIELIYSQTFSNYFIEGSYMKIIINGDHVKSLERKWLSISYEEDESTSLIPFSVALFRLLGEVYNEESEIDRIVIDSITIGYSLKGSIFNTDILSGEASPYYKFHSTSGEVYLIEALDVE